MKPLFFFLLITLTVVVYADPYVLPLVHYSAVPLREVVTISERPVYPASNSIVTAVSDAMSLNEPIITSTTYRVEKPMEKPVALPKPPAPLLPLPVLEQVPVTLVGQVRSVNQLAEVLDTPPPLAQGTVEEGTIDPKLIDTFDPSESDIDVLGQHLIQVGAVEPGTKSADPLGNGVLLTTMVIVTIGLVYMAFIAYDYRQRWMQSLTTQNDRYLGGGAFDWEAENTYSSPVGFSDGLGLTRRSSM